MLGEAIPELVLMRMPGFCKSSTVEEIKKNGYVLTPVAMWARRR